MKVLFVLLCLVVVGLAAVFHLEGKAKDRATAFCQGAVVGSTSDLLLDRARAAGADMSRTRWVQPQTGPRVIFVTFMGLPPFSQHVCHIEGWPAVLKANYRHLG